MKSLASFLGELTVIILFINVALGGFYTAALILQAIVEIVR